MTTQGTWPEPLDAPSRPKDPFPFRLIIPWGLVGVVGLALLIGLSIYFDQRASKQIAFVDSGGVLKLIRADGQGEKTVTSAIVKVTGSPQWSPDGRLLAAVDQQGNGLILAQVGAEIPRRIALSSSQIVGLATDAWSPDGQVVALMEGSGPSSAVRLLPISSSGILSDPTPIDTRFPVDWHPRNNELLFTGVSVTATLQILSTDGRVRDLLPQDQRTTHWAGAWSSDGTRVAYAASNSAQEHTWGDIWLASADGSNAQLLVAGQNGLPIWAPNGGSLVYSSLVTKTGDIDLYLVSSSGGTPVRIGTGVPLEWYAQRGVQSFVAWSPDGNKTFFQSYNKSNQQLTIYVARADGTNAQPVTSPLSTGTSALSAQWAPTSRNLLVSRNGTSLMLYTVDRETTPRNLASGGFPAWQP